MKTRLASLSRESKSTLPVEIKNLYYRPRKVEPKGAEIEVGGTGLALRGLLPSNTTNAPKVEAPEESGCESESNISGGLISPKNLGKG